LFLSWGDANLRHIEKYINLYTELYPAATIIIVKSGMADFFYRTQQTLRRLLEPVVKMLRESGEDSLLVHIMSNGGSKQWCEINKLYSEATGRTLSNAVTILDSAPGRSRFKQTFATLSRSLPRAFLPRMTLGFVFGVFLCIMHVGKYVLPWPDLLEVIRSRMNDPAGIVKGVRRCYIYSEQDDIIGWQDVEDHAREAEQKGWAVELVKFQGSTHVGHFKHNPARYRETIEKTWFGRSKL
jgi:hypothetical protein